MRARIEWKKRIQASPVQCSQSRELAPPVTPLSRWQTTTERQPRQLAESICSSNGRCQNIALSQTHLLSRDPTSKKKRKKRKKNKRGEARFPFPFPRHLQPTKTTTTTVHLAISPPVTASRLTVQGSAHKETRERRLHHRRN